MYHLTGTVDDNMFSIKRSFVSPVFLRMVIIIINNNIIIIIIIKFLTSQLRLGNIHLSWYSAINSIRLGGLIYSLESF